MGFSKFIFDGNQTNFLCLSICAFVRVCTCACVCMCDYVCLCMESHTNRPEGEPKPKLKVQDSDQNLARSLELRWCQLV